MTQPPLRAVAQSGSVGDTQIILSVPTVHCAACMRAIEQHLEHIPGVHEARVNLSLKRCIISGNSRMNSAQLIDAITSIGYPAEELDSKLLEQGRDDPHGRALLTRLAVAGFAMMNVMLLSISVWAGAEGRHATCFIGSRQRLRSRNLRRMPFLRTHGQCCGMQIEHGCADFLAIVLALGTSIWEHAVWRTCIFRRRNCFDLLSTDRSISGSPYT